MLRRFALAVLLVGFGAVGASAQLLQFPVEPPAPFMRESLDTPFARVLMAEFAKSVQRKADAGLPAIERARCRKARRTRA